MVQKHFYSVDVRIRGDFYIKDSCILLVKFVLCIVKIFVGLTVLSHWGHQVDRGLVLPTARFKKDRPVSSMESIVEVLTPMVVEFVFFMS